MTRNEKIATIATAAVVASVPTIAFIKTIKGRAKTQLGRIDLFSTAVSTDPMN